MFRYLKLVYGYILNIVPKYTNILLSYYKGNWYIEM